MNPLDQRIAIAESVGWTVYHRNDKGEIKSWKSPDGSIWQEPWTPLRFTEDLNAMHEVEKTLTLDQRHIYYQRLWHICDKAHRMASVGECLVPTATAAQRAEAYLRTIGKWKD